MNDGTMRRQWARARAPSARGPLAESGYNSAHMRGTSGALGVAALLLLTACSGGTGREWMKIDQPYTTAEFRRDYAECSKGGQLDEDCMKRRGWVTVTRPKVEEKPSEPEDPRYRSR